MLRALIFNQRVPMKTLLVFVFVALSLPAFAKDTFSITISIDQTDRYSLTSARSASGSESSALYDIALTVNSQGRSISTSFSTSQDEALQTQLTINETTTRFTDANQNLDVTVKSARKLDTARAAVESLVISKQEIKKVLEKQLKAQGLALMTSLGMSTEEGSLNYSLDLSDYNCSADEAFLNCSLKATVKFDISGN